MHCPKSFVFFSALALTACGHPVVEELQEHCPRATSGVNIWPGSDTLRQSKQTVLNACANKVSPDRAALVLAVLMGETENGTSAERDASKDCRTDDAANYSAFNMNKCFLKKLGWQEGRGPDLNDQANLAAATDWVLKGMEVFGEDGFLNYHRGGETGFTTKTAYGCESYRSCMRQIQKTLIEKPNLLQSNDRVAMEIPHV